MCLKSRFCGLMLLLLGISFFMSNPAWAQYPSKPVRIIIGFTPGGNTDIFGRMFAEHMQQNLGQPVIVENKPGAATMIASQYVASAPADGYTLCLCVTNVATNKYAYERVPYELSDFSPAALMFTSTTGLIVPANSPFKTVEELVEFAKRNPGKLNYSTTGSGGATHLAGALFTSVTDVDAMAIHYKGAAPAAMAAVAGEVDFTFSTITTALPFLQSDRVRMLAVAGEQRMKAVSDVPTMAEVGYAGVVTSIWYGLLAPAGTPENVIAILNGEVRSFIDDPAINDRFISNGEQPRGDLTPQQFAEFIEKDTEHMRKIMEPLNLKL